MYSLVSWRISSRSSSTRTRARSRATSLARSSAMATSRRTRATPPRRARAAHGSLGRPAGDGRGRTCERGIEMRYEFIRFEEPQEHVAVVTLHRPERLNALHGPLLDELADAVERVERGPGIRAWILTG